MAKMKKQTLQPFSLGKSMIPPPPPVLMEVTDSVNNQNFFKKKKIKIIELKTS